MRYFLFLFLFSFFPISGRCQSYHFKNYTVEDGLPSSEVYRAFQDSKGYMWFATDAGVSRFNGYEFQNFDSSDGLADNTIFIITEDKLGRIWFGSFSCQLSYYEDGKIHQYEFNDQVSKYIQSKHSMVSFNVDDQLNVWIGFNAQGLIKIDEFGKIVECHNSDVSKSSIEVIQKDKCLMFGMYRTYRQQTEILFNILDPNKLTTNYSGQIESDFGSSDVHALLVGLAGDTLILKVYDDKLNYFDLKTKKTGEFEIDSTLKSGVFNGLSYSKGYLTLCNHENGVYRYTLRNDSVIKTNHFLEGISSATAYEDQSGGYWISTLNNGIFYSPAFLIEKDFMQLELSKMNKPVEMEISHDGNLYIRTYGDFFVKNLVSEHADVKFNHISDFPLSITVIDSLHEVVFHPSNRVVHIRDSLWKTDTVSDLFKESQLKSTNKNHALRNSGHFIVIEDGVVEYADRNSSHFHTCHLKNGEDYWIGTNQGVRVYKNKKVSFPFQSNRYLSSAITSMERFDDSRFLIGTKVYGVLVIQNGELIDVLDSEDGLVGSLVRDVHVDGDKTIWVGTNKGITRISNLGEPSQEIYSINESHGLSSPEIIDLESFQNDVYVLTKDGISKFDKNQVSNYSTSPMLVINAVYVNSKEQNLRNHTEFGYTDNFFRFNFEGIEYRNANNVIYEYRLLGAHSNWISTTNRSVPYPSLFPGEYEFQVRAKSQNSDWTYPEAYPFTINPPFWSRWWFKLLWVMLTLAIIYVVFKLRLKQLKFRNEHKRKIAETDKRLIEQELTALRSQMNPHFIFNTLSAIRNAIQTLDKSIASDYTMKFAKMIRMVLESSKSPTIDLTEEIELLKLYLDLESIRFSHKFNHTIESDFEIDCDTFLIPTMIIQPVVENALLHGLLPKESEDLKLKIKFSLLHDSAIVCIVEDNGIGRKKSQEIQNLKKIKKKSMGLQITKDRLKLHYEGNYSQKLYTITDLFDQQNMPSGTRVKIIFPF